MSKVILNDTTLTAIADAIRGKTGITDSMLPNQMAGKIQDIGGGELPEYAKSVKQWFSNIKVMTYANNGSYNVNTSSFSIPSDLTNINQIIGIILQSAESVDINFPSSYSSFTSWGCWNILGPLGFLVSRDSKDNNCMKNILDISSSETKDYTTMVSLPIYPINRSQSNNFPSDLNALMFKNTRYSGNQYSISNGKLTITKQFVGPAYVIYGV